MGSENNMSLYKQLRTNTMSNIETRKAKQDADKQEYDIRLSRTLDKLTETITETCVEKMMTASQEGHFYATLYSFTNQDLFNEFKTVFLIKGPFRSKYTHCLGLVYFEQRHMTPILTRLYEEYAPVEIYMKYDRLSRTHHIMATWKNE